MCWVILFVYLETNLLFFRSPAEAISQAFAAYSRLAWNIHWTDKFGSSKGNFTAFPEKGCETSTGNRKKGQDLEVNEMMVRLRTLEPSTLSDCSNFQTYLNLTSPFLPWFESSHSCLPLSCFPALSCSLSLSPLLLGLSSVSMCQSLSYS